MVLHTEDKRIRELLFQGQFGLERENLRVTKEGRLAKTAHPFSDHPNITMDFSENQMEINTPVCASAREALKCLREYSAEAMQILKQREEPEYLWPFSNPPYIDNEQDIPIARFTGRQAPKTTYREYLAQRYGRYKMTFCGTHVNYSFSEALLKADYEISGTGGDYQTYKNQLYLSLAEQAVQYSWLLTALTAASPLTDRSFMEQGQYGGAVFTGMGSLRCGESGYWNSFTPIFEYDTMAAYTDRIRYYVDLGLIISPSELYYPVRLKPRGNYCLDRLRSEGADHIELRMFDLNPLSPEGVDLRDLTFAQLLLIYLGASRERTLTPKDQIQAAWNMKNAARYDLESVRIVMPGEEPKLLPEAGRAVIRCMGSFFENLGEKTEEIREVLDFEEAKLIDPHRRYASVLRARLGDDYVKNGCGLFLRNCSR